MPTRFDAIVVGGGPAGSVAAILLARMGWRVVLAERKGRHRDKTCGHCLSPRGVSMLNSLALGPLIAQISRGLTSVLRLHVPDRSPLELPLDFSAARGGPRHSESETPRGIVTRRDELDQLLLDAAARAGATIVQPGAARIERMSNGEAIVTIGCPASEQGSGSSASRCVAAPLLIGADGLASRVASGAGLESRRRSHARYGFSMTIDLDDQAKFHRDTIHMFASQAGYLGIVQNGTAMLHVAALVRLRRGRILSPRRFLDLIAAQFPALRDVCDAAAASRRILAAGPMQWRTRRVANEHVALLGDAAGYVEPFTGEGMTSAIESAMLLARSLRDVPPGTWNRYCADSYARAWRERIERRLHRCRWIARAVASPMLMSAVTGAGWLGPVISRCVARKVVSA
jgi:flavin-dependent dehydrogenase